jgi:hypothetical protein
MHKLTLQSLFVIAGLAASPAGFAIGGVPAALKPVSPVVLSAVPDFKQSTLVILGEHFGSAMPTVRLANAVLMVKSASANRIVTSLPAGIQPATYRLTVTVEDGRHRVTSEAFHVGLYANGGR